MPCQILLIGDSVIDNGAYVLADQPDVARQLRAIMPSHEIEMRAVDGSVTKDVIDRQLSGLRDDDLVVLSSGGNDALAHVDLIAPGSGSGVLAEFADFPHQSLVAAILSHVRKIQAAFQVDYANLLDAVAAEDRRVLCLTIYNPLFEANGLTADQQRAAEAAVALFNDVIQREAIRRGCGVLEMRSLLVDAADFANPIEPSAIGGAKIASAVKRWATDV